MVRYPSLLSRLELAVFCCEVTEVCLLYTLVENQYVSMNMDIAATDQLMKQIDLNDNYIII